MKTIVYSTHGFDKPYLESSAGGKHQLSFTRQPLNSLSASLAEGYEAAILFSNDSAPSAIIDRLYHCGIRFLIYRSTCTDQVDIEYAKNIGMKVACIQDYASRSVAEHAITLLLSLNRKIQLGQKLMAKDDFRLDRLVGFEMFNKTVGIMGTGKIGSHIARILQGFGCEILGCDPEPNQKLVKELGIRYVREEELLKKSDVVILSCPLTSTNHYAIDRRAMEMMKSSALLINVGRGGLIHTLDLIETLQEGKIGGAALDVYENEGRIFFNYRGHIPVQDAVFNTLRKLPNVLITGHQGFLTKESLKSMAVKTIRQLDNWAIMKQRGIISPSGTFIP